MEGHRTAERRSLAYHRAIADRLAAEPGLVIAARERVARWCATGEVHARYARAWEALLRERSDTIAIRLGEESEEMAALRQASPFAGALEPRVRWQIWRSVS